MKHIANSFTKMICRFHKLSLKFKIFFPQNGGLNFSQISSLQIPAKISKNGALEIEIHFVKTRRHKHQTTNHDF